MTNTNIINSNSNTNNALITMNITTDLAALITIVKQNGYLVIKPRKVVTTEADKENGMKLRALRKSIGEKGLTIKEFAKRINRHPQYVWGIENGKYPITLRFSQCVYEAFRVRPDVRFHEKEKAASNIVSL